MTSKTARANAAQKAADREARKVLYAKWLDLMERESPPREEYLKIGGTDAELTDFFYQYAS